MINELEEICYHHYSFNFDKNLIPTQFLQIKVILVAGCKLRAELQAQYLADHLENPNKLRESNQSSRLYRLELLTKPTSRFALYRVGPVLIGDHGMGGASMSIAIHELMLMCKQAKILDQITLIRFGTCGGIGVEAGDLCITRRAVDPLLQDFVELKICLRLVRRPCTVDQATADLLEKLALEQPNPKELGVYKIHSGATLAANDFYEEQGRTNGAICEHTLNDKQQFLEQVQKAGVINSEMESNYLAAMCHKLGVSFGIVCVALTNRLKQDKIDLTRDQMDLCQRRLFWLNLLLVRHKIGIPS